MIYQIQVNQIIVCNQRLQAEAAQSPIVTVTRTQINLRKPELSKLGPRGVLLGRLKRTTAPAQVSQDGMNVDSTAVGFS
jgi:hypothetical protein